MAEALNFQPTEVVWDERHCQILTVFINALKEKGIRHFILKNADGLPFENHSKDIDILIEPGKYKDASELLKKAYKENGITYYRVHKFERLRCWYGFNPDDKFAIHIDLLEGFLHKGFEIYPFEVLYSHTYLNDNGIFVLDDIYENVILLLHSTICYHRIKEKYVERIKTAYSLHREEIRSILESVLGVKAASRMCGYLDSGAYSQIEREGKYFSRESKKRILLRRPVFTICNVVDFLWEKTARLVFNFEKYNVFLSVHAPDGTGKTTFIKEFCQLLGYYYVCDPGDLTRIYHFRPCLFPNLGAAAEKVGVMKQDKDFTKPHRARPAGALSSLLRMSYYVFDYIIGTPIILRRNAQFDKITVFDRYVYDLIVDPQRTRISLPLWVRKCLISFVRKPQLSFVLNADADIILKRKQELTYEEITRQLSEFKTLSGNRKDEFVVLDASKSPEEIASDAVSAYMEKFAVRL